MIDLSQYEVLTFDCYGILIDWESGILEAIAPILSAHNVSLDAEQILSLFAQFESEGEQGEYIPYREVLRRVVQRFGDRLSFEPSASELDSLPESIKRWHPFPDTVEALHSLKKQFKLAIISNVDDDLFNDSAQHLKVKFDWVITAQQTKSYKPSLNNFHLAMARIEHPKQKLLHVAASVYHDIVPANALELSTVWVNRRGKTGAGAALSATGKPDWEVPDLQSLASMS